MAENHPDSASTRDDSTRDASTRDTEPAVRRQAAQVAAQAAEARASAAAAAAKAALAVVEEIRAGGGQAMASGASVTDPAAVQTMVDEAVQAWGRVDILVNNAGILRDKSFAKMTLDDFRAVVEVHLMGAVNCTHAVWSLMRAQNYGRIVMTTSSTGLYGNF
ncbi:MAG: SDR family NAD(P)-dependent oxidoreductase, partial [Pseudonocardia sp.]|nr:SDR family NAD(P)-dependent oxidoreductase [Pseudonocardia sp.]